MGDIRDVVLARKASNAQLEPVRDFTLAVLIFVDSVDNDAKAQGIADYVWISEFNQPESTSKVLNRAVPPTVGLTVKVGYPEKPPFQKQVLGVWDGIDTLTGYTPEDGGALNSSPHAQAHQYPSEANPGDDVVNIYQPAIQALKTTGDGSTLNVSVQALMSYRFEDTWKSFGGGGWDMSTYVPVAASSKRQTLVYLDATTNQIGVVTGGVVADVDAVTAPKPPIPVGCIASAYVQLSTGQLSISTYPDVTDAREFLHPKSGIPIVDQFGEILTDEAGRIMVV